MNSKKKNEISNRMELLASNLRDEMRLTNVDRISLTQIMRDKNILGVFLSLDENFSGMAVKTTDENNHSMYFMLINNKQSFAKQRFTGCHELYHLLYQEDFQVSSNNAGNYSDIDENEYSADVFAKIVKADEFIKQTSLEMDNNRFAIAIRQDLQLIKSKGLKF